MDDIELDTWNNFYLYHYHKTKESQQKRQELKKYILTDDDILLKDGMKKA